MTTIQILSIEAWRDGEGWTWNNWHKRGTITADQLAAVTTATGKADTRKMLALLRAEGLDIPAGKVAIDDDGHNFVVIQKNTREPLYAIAYGDADDVGDIGKIGATTVSQAAAMCASAQALDDADATIISIDAAGGAILNVQALADALGVSNDALLSDSHWSSTKEYVTMGRMYAPLSWPQPVPMSAESLAAIVGNKRARIVGSQRARVLRKRGDIVRYAYDTKTGKRRFIWLMPKGDI